MGAGTKHPLLRVRKKNLDITIGPSAVGIFALAVFAAMIAFGLLTAENIAAILSKLRP